MGLNPMPSDNWIETDNTLADYVQHKLAIRSSYGDRVWRAEEASLPAQREFSDRLKSYLLAHASEVYGAEGESMSCALTDLPEAGEADEVLWNASLWVADDLVLMEQRGGDYCLTAASLCCPSYWHLDEKFGRPMREIHDPIPGIHDKLSPSIDRFFDHLKPSHPVVRFNWSLQSWFGLAEFPDLDVGVDADSELFYRTERQSLLRLPETGAVAFTIRVYLHPLSDLARFGGAMPALFAAIDAMPAPLVHYKGFDRLAPALVKYRELGA